MRQQRARGLEGQLQIAGDDVLNGQRAAAIGHVDHGDAGGRLEQFGGQVRHRPVPARAIAELSGIGLGVGDQVGHRVERQRRIDHQDDRALGIRRDRRKAFQRVVARVLVDQRRDHLAAGAAHQQRVAVGIAVGDVAGAERVAGAAAVLDEELLAQGRAEIVGHDPGDEIDGPRGNRGHDDLHRPVRIGLRAQRQRAAKEQQRRGGRAQPRAPRSWLVEPERLDDRRPFGEIGLDHGREIRRRAAERRVAEPLKCGFQFRRLQPVIDRSIELGDDRRPAYAPAPTARSSWWRRNSEIRSPPWSARRAVAGCALAW